MPGLVLQDISKSFGDTPVLSDINLSIKPGELVVVLGPSGCGKSTLLRLIAGLDAPDCGRIILDDVDITGLEPQKRKTAMVFQNYALYPHLTVFDNLAFPLRIARRPKEEIAAAVGKTAALLELQSLLGRRPAELSGGQRQRVALGRGLIRQPSIFLLDEPLSNLDAGLRQKMRQEIVALQKQVGVSMIYVTHDQIEALTMADRMAILREGRIRQVGRPSEIYEHPADSTIAAFIGTPPINLIEDDITGGIGRALPIEYGSGIPDGRYKIGIRPEHIALGSDGPLQGTITAVEYIGATSHIRVSLGTMTLTVVADHRQGSFQPGRRVTLAIDSGRVHLFRD